MSSLAQRWAPSPTSNSGNLSDSHAGSGDKCEGLYQERKRMKREGHMGPCLKDREAQVSGSSVRALVPAQTLDEVGKWAHGVSRPSPGDLPNPGINPRSPSLLVDSLLSEATKEASKYWSG